MKSLKERVDAAIAEVRAMSDEEFRAVFEDAEAEADTDPTGLNECPPEKKLDSPSVPPRSHTPA